MSLIKALKSSIISIAIVCIIMIIILPLPSFVLDFLLMTDLALGLMILLVTTNVTSALQLSVFPSLLLVTTLFRLSLEIQSTRQILSNDGSAGDVIKTFGTVVMNGNVVIGIVVFLIIVVAQFIVITKGSERVAEVAARFTLDAMPGKQMAIDADLNSGLITEDAARKRRSDIQRAADFYGSMDGASKFVKGDAILSIVMMIINIVGGIITGVLNGGEIGAVMNTYTIATIGSGLMAQLPALLISTSTGIIVTRAASEDNMSSEFSKQLFSQPLVLRTTGIVLLLMMFINGFPKPILILVGGSLVLASFASRKKGKSKEKTNQQQVAQNLSKANSELEQLKNPDNVYSMLEVETIEMEFGYSLIPLVEESQGGTFVDKVVLFRRQFALETGVVIPSVRMRDNIQLANNRYTIKIRGEKVAEGSLLVGNLMIMNPLGDEFLIDGIDTIEPAFGLTARWIPVEKRDEAEMDGYTVIEPASVMMTHLSEVIRRHAPELLGRREVNSMLDVVKKHNQALVDEVIPTKISVGDLQKVFENLLHENIPIRDTVTILETLADNAPRIKDPDLLTEFVRQSLKRTVTHKIAPDGDLKVMTIDPSVEKQITSSVRTSDHGTYLALDPDAAQGIIDNLSQEVERFNKAGLPPVVLVSPAVRMYFRRLTEQVLPDLFVVSYNEIENDVKVTAVGEVAA